jgi:hypothetical protein
LQVAVRTVDDGVNLVVVPVISNLGGTFSVVIVVRLVAVSITFTIFKCSEIILPGGEKMTQGMCIPVIVEDLHLFEDVLHLGHY